MKRITFFTYFVFILIFAFTFSSLIYASDDLYRDEVGLISENEAEYVSKLLSEIKDTYEIKLIIVIVNDTGYKSAYNYAADHLYSSLGSSESGAILLLSMEERDWAFYATGRARRILTDSKIDNMMEILISDYFSRDDYYGGFCGLINQCTSYFVRAAEDGIDPSDDYDEDDDLSISSCLMIALVIGLVASGITVLVLRGQLKSVKSARCASNYVDSGSFALTESRDIYLYSTISKTARSQSSSSGSRSGGGRSGKF